MPFLGAVDDADGFVVPEEVEDGETVRCPRCSGRMRPRGAGDDRARHFMHVDNLGGATSDQSCPGPKGGGESDRHRVLKSQAVSGLGDQFADFDVATLDLEVDVDTSRGPSLYDTRRADALVRFANAYSKPNRFWGKGVIVEVQQHNDTKDAASVTADYLSAGYSVYWAHDAAFSDTHFRTGRFHRAFTERWPNAFAPYFTDATKALHYTEGVEFDPSDLADSNWSFLDPRPDCSHSVHPVHHGCNFCLDCGTEFTQHDTGRQMYRALGDK